MHKYFIKTALATLALILGSPVLASEEPTIFQSSQLPHIGGTASGTLPPYQERALGEQIIQEIQYQIPILEDPLSYEYINQLGLSLAQYTSPYLFPYEFFIINSPVINAFALPGGFIGFYSGLILLARTEDQLAGVLAHEISHVSQRHIARMFERSEQLTLPVLAGLIGSILLGIGTQNSQLGASAMLSTLAGAQQAAINFTRANEEEADRLGLELLAKAGYNTMAMPQFFHLMDRATRYNDSQLYPDFLRTHPLSVDRLADTEARAKSYPLIDRSQQQLPFKLFKARIRFFSQNQAKANLAYFMHAVEESKTSIDKTANQYGYALSLAQHLQFAESLKIAEELSKKHPNNRWLQLLPIEIQGQQKSTLLKAEKAIRKLHKKYPLNRAVTLIAAQIYLRAENYQETEELLIDYTREYPRDATAWSLLSEAQGQLNKLANAHASRAQWFKLNGLYYDAVKQLERAISYAEPDSFQAIRLESELEQTKNLAIKHEKR